MSTSESISRSAEVRARLGHPVIDSDGHTVEFLPGILDCLKEIAGSKLVDRFITSGGAHAFYDSKKWYGMTPEQRRDWRPLRAPWWAVAAENTLDRATATLPKLLHKRMDEIGMDFAVIFPSMRAQEIHDEELRRAMSRAYTRYHADVFREYSDRLTPAAEIPMHTPQEAIEELEYAVEELGLKVALFPSYVRRPVAAIGREFPQGAGLCTWLDNYCLDSEYDYDPVWRKCVELKIAPAFHSSHQGVGARTSISNYMYNHLGHFASAGESICKALFMGGVTRRFPTLQFAFLECGVAWACSLYSDLIGHWKKRNAQAVERYNPERLDRDVLVDLFRRYGDEVTKGRLERLDQIAAMGLGTKREETSMLDEWAPCAIEKPEDIKDLFVPHFFFGCESDDPITACAFNRRMNPFGARLNAIFSSDVGHWDVPDMREVVEEAHELVEQEIITEDDFCDFTFRNPARLWAGMNPDFFKGTVVENAVTKLLSQRG